MNEMNKMYQKKLCDYLLNKELLETTLENKENYLIKKITFRKDVDKNLLYSKVYSYHDTYIDFIYKLSKEIEYCSEIEKK